MATTSITPDQDAIIAEIEIAAPPERVFRALIDPAQVQEWSKNDFCELTTWELDPQVGGFWQSISTPYEGKGDPKQRFEHHGRVLEIKPPHLLVFTWLANFHDDPKRETVVRWELTPTTNGTRVKMTHSGLAQEPKSREEYSGGWPGLLQAIKQYLEK